MEYLLSALAAMGSGGGGGSTVATATADTNVTVNPNITSINVIDTDAIAAAIGNAGEAQTGVLKNIRLDLANALKIASAALMLVWVVARKWR